MKRHPAVRRKSELHLWLMEHSNKRTSGLGKPISEDTHYIVRVFYGGYWCEEALFGPFATPQEAQAVADEQHVKGHGAIVYACSSMKYIPRESV